jgi:beta-lactam-binding protein with PASTA domain/tRNA A-37 threonylcarbamoyl transferase component Bud32
VATSRIVDHVGRVLGNRYRLLAPIGTGASAHVFLADDVALKRQVAVKILHAALAEDESFLKRFRAEAQSAAVLNHPHIMRVYDWGEDTDGPYLVLEYLGGGSLRDLLDAGRRLSPSQALMVGIEAARALDYAHRRGLVHRDIKPANLLFDDEGRLCIADFGLARALAEAAWTEPAGAVLGTARYASPEQAQGSSVDGRADVYGLALALVEAVTGRVPFSADTTIATLMARVGAELPPDDTLGPLYPILQQAAAPDPADRLDAAALVAALQALSNELPPPEPVPVLVGARPTAEVVPRDLTEHGRRARRAKPAVYDREADLSPLGLAGAAAVLPAAAEPKPRRRWLLGALLTILVVVAGAAAAYGIRWVTLPSYAVPQLRGQSVAQARNAVADEGFGVKVATRAYDETAPAGTILDQDPSSGKLKKGSTIKVVTSKGPAPRDVPPLDGVDEPTAVQRLTQAGFVAKLTHDYHEEIAKGHVIDWQPQGRQAKGAEIVVTLSNGPTPKPLANVAGKSYEEAAKALADAGLTPVRKDVFDDDVAPGKVVSTTPEAGTPVARGDRITVNVSKGPERIPVPNVIGKSVDEARAIITRAGFQVSGVFGPARAKRVFETDPEPGVKVRRGTPIALYAR